MGTYKDLMLYKKSFTLAMEIYNVTKQFPKEETYSLTDQIRRSSRSTNICTIEAYRKRRYRLRMRIWKTAKHKAGLSFQRNVVIFQKMFITI